MDQKTARLRWGTEQRLEFIEFRLFWDGSIQPRADIIDRFGVSDSRRRLLTSPSIGRWRLKISNMIQAQSATCRQRNSVLKF